MRLTEPHPKKKGGSLKRECVLVYLSYIDCQSMMVKLAPIWLPYLIRGALQKKDLTIRYVYPYWSRTTARTAGLWLHSLILTQLKTKRT